MISVHIAKIEGNIKKSEYIGKVIDKFGIKKRNLQFIFEN